MKLHVLFLLIISLSFAQPAAPLTTLNTWFQVGLGLIGALLFTMIVVAVSVYVIGQIFGGDIKAKSVVWTESMLAAVGVSALVIVIMFVLIKLLFPGGSAQPPNFLDVISQVRGLAELGLRMLVIILAVLAAIVYALGMVSGSETRARATGYANNLIAATLVVAVLYFGLFQVLFSASSPIAGIFATIGPSAILSPYLNLMVSVFFFVSLIIFLTYLISKVFRIPEWEAYLSTELSGLVGSFILIVFVAGFFIAGSQIVGDYAGSAYAGSSPPQAAIKFLQADILDPILHSIYDVYSIQACTSMLSVYARRIGESVLTRSYKVFPGIDTFVSISNVLSYGLVAVYGAISAQITILYFIDSLMGAFFLPAGLILHFFPPTREAGAFLISFAIGFQLVFPLGYLIDKAAYEALNPAGYQSPTGLIWSICGPANYATFGYIFNAGAKGPAAIFGLLPGGATIQKTLGAFFSEGTLGLLPMPEFTLIMQHLALLSLLSLFMPALSIMVTIAFINAMTKFILQKV